MRSWTQSSLHVVPRIAMRRSSRWGPAWRIHALSTSFDQRSCGAIWPRRAVPSVAWRRP